MGRGFREEDLELCKCSGLYLEPCVHYCAGLFLVKVRGGGTHLAPPSFQGLSVLQSSRQGRQFISPQGPESYGNHKMQVGYKTVDKALSPA